ncbi:MAG: hypothetical protein HUJ31_15785 [Pseudomonadales bacterium]|nr:hypothetical protein [Pseudomonadales bacterium]
MAELFPLWWATAISIALFLIIGAACWLLPRDDVLADAPDRARWRDLRWWALLLVAVQIAIYLLFS